MTELVVPVISLKGNILVIKTDTYWACLFRALHSEASCLKKGWWDGVKDGSYPLNDLV